MFRVIAFASVVTASFMAGVIFGDSALRHVPLCLTPMTVIDGDTIRCEHRDIRLKGFDTPESRAQNASCPEEIALGKIAKCTLQQMTKDGGWILTKHKGGGGYKRSLAELTIGGRNVGDTLISLRLAQAWNVKGLKPNWCKIIEHDPGLLQLGCTTK